jgi:hypothetical protein
MKALLAKAARRLFPHDRNGLAGLAEPDRRLVAELQQQRLTYLSDRKLASIVDACRTADRESLPGMFIEAGCALGGSTILISRVKRQDRELRVYDVFGMIPQPTEADGEDVQDRYATIKAGQSSGIGGDKYYGYEEDLYGKVQANLRRFDVDAGADRVQLIKGLVQDTLAVDGPVAFAHIDVDWYDPVKTCLERIMPQLVAGGSIILDDYNDWSGCRKATDDYFEGRWGDFRRTDRAGSLKITRLGA